MKAEQAVKVFANRGIVLVDDAPLEGAAAHAGWRALAIGIAGCSSRSPGCSMRLCFPGTLIAPLEGVSQTAAAAAACCSEATG